MTLEDYFKSEFANGAIDFLLRAHVWNGVVEIYIHPSGRDGSTTPTLIVDGDFVRPKFAQHATSADADRSNRERLELRNLMFDESDGAE